MKKKYIKGLLCSLILLLFAMNLSAQQETYNWVFGRGTGLTWNQTRSFTAKGINVTGNTVLEDLPTTFNSAINTVEGCFTLSDKNGNLLFYSDGVSVWNRNNVIMPNGTGLTGDSSSAQSGIIVPYPGKEGVYIAFTIGATTQNILAYTIIDMSLNGGLGGIVEKNIKLTNYGGAVGESMTAIKHANNIDYWILAPGRGGTSTIMNAWLLTGQGISSEPVKSTIPFKLTINSNGYLKIRPDGKYFIWPTFADQTFIYGRFDKSTGMVSDSRQLTGFSFPYGVEYSSNLKLVYLKTNTDLRVYKLDDLFNNNISPKIINTPGTIQGAIQLSPEGRLYIPSNNTRNMLVIDNINDYDNFKVYELTNFTSQVTTLGLPSFSASFFTAEIEEQPFICRGNSFSFTTKIEFAGAVEDLPERLDWNWGDGSPIESQPVVIGQNVYKRAHNYLIPGNYQVVITPYKAGNLPLDKITLNANVINCKLVVNRNIRVNLTKTE